MEKFTSEEVTKIVILVGWGYTQEAAEGMCLVVRDMEKRLNK